MFSNGRLDRTPSKEKAAIMATITKSIAQLAEEHFLSSERLRVMGQMNMPQDYEARKKQAIEYAEAQAAEAAAKRALDDAIKNS